MHVLWSLARRLPSCCRLHRAAVERQLLDRASELRVESLPSSFTVPLRGLVGVDRVARGESRLRRKSCRKAAIMGSAVLRGGRAARKLSEKLVWRTSASSVDIRRPARPISSSTASPQRPHTHRPLNRPRTASTYAGVHSSVSPQHSHIADTTSGLASPPHTSSDITRKSYLSSTTVQSETAANRAKNKKEITLRLLLPLRSLPLLTPVALRGP
ncbi:unnamed protein product [Musa acuminata subsp. burmannicoides]